jgi:hypothetical protein
MPTCPPEQTDPFSANLIPISCGSAWAALPASIGQGLFGVHHSLKIAYNKNEIQNCHHLDNNIISAIESFL